MFCGNCGSKNEDGAKFCASCGTLLQAVAAAPAAEAPAEAAAPAFEQPAETPAPVIEQPAPAVEPVQAPAFEQPAPAVEPVQAPAFEQPAPAVEPVQAPAFEQPVPAVEPVQVPAFEQPAPAVEPVQAPAFEQPAQYMQPEAAAPVKKKKGKAGLIIGLSAAAVVLGGAAVGYFCFHADITRMIMGDAKYAEMLEKSVIERSGVNEEEIYKAVSLASQSAGSAYKSFSTLSAGNMELSQEANDITTQIVGSGLLDSVTFDKIPEGTSLTTTSSMNLKLGSVFAMLDNETTRKIINTINSFAMTSKVANGSTDMVSFGITDNNGHSGSFEMYINDSGLLVTFPGISDKKVFLSKAEIDEAKAKLSGSDNIVKGLDPAELRRLRKEVVELYSESIGKANITYTKNVTWSESISGSADTVNVSVSGTDACIVFTPEVSNELIKKVFALLREDAYLVGYAKDTLGMEEEQYKALFNDEGIDLKGTLTMHYIADVHNNVLASSVEIGADDGTSISFRDVGGERDKVIVVSSKDKDGKGVTVTCGSSNKTAADGIAILGIDSSIPGLTIDDIKFECSFTGTATKKFAGNDVPVGKYVIKPSDPDKLFGSFEKMFGGSSDPVVEKTMANTDSGSLGGNQAMLEEIKKFTITLENTLENDVYSTSSELSLGEIGSIGFSGRIESKQESVEMPDISGALKVTDEKLGEQLAEDAVKWAGGFAEAFDISGDVLSGLLGGSLGGVVSPVGGSKYTDHYKAYTDLSEYTASTFAYSISEAVSQKISEKKDADGIIRLYFRDGNVRVIENGGIDGLESLTYTNEYVTDPLDSVYAEIIYNNKTEPSILGVNVVLTDDPDDLPGKLPDAINYYNYSYPWEDDKNGYIGEFVVGTSPYLMTGEPTITELIQKPAADIYLLNAFAETAAENANDLAKGFTTGYIADPGHSGAMKLCYYTDDGIDWYLDSGLVSDTSYTDEQLQSGLLGVIRDTADYLALNGRSKVAIYFDNQKILGAAVFADPGESWDFNADIMPTAGDFARGFCCDWKIDEYGDVQVGYAPGYDNLPIGTYCISTGSTLNAPSAAPETKYDGVWTVTDINGKEITAEEFGYTGLQVIVDGYKCTISANSGENMHYVLEYGASYEGKSALQLNYRYSNNPGGYLVFDSATSGRLIDIYVEEDGNETVTIANFTAGSGGAVSSDNFSITDVAGIWSLNMGDEYCDVTIDMNYVMAIYDTNVWITDDDYYLLDPSDEGMTIYSHYDVSRIGSLTYNKEDDTLTVTADGEEPKVLARVDTAAAYAYFGTWTMDSYEGLDMDAYCEKYNRTPDEFAMNIDIGAYTGLALDANGWTILTMKQPGVTTFKLAFDSSMFFDCTYDPATDTITSVLRFDDNDTTQTAIFKRGMHQFGE